MSAATIGYEDLDANGSWQTVPQYGAVWVPRVRGEWAPYRFGRWAWVEPWGWTWIDDEPWGFAPFHYGRWAFCRHEAGRGCRARWSPAQSTRPLWWRSSVDRTGRSRLAPARRSAGFRSVRAKSTSRRTARPHSIRNASTRRHAATVNVTSVTYVNRTVPGAVTAVSRETFVRSQPVARATVVVSREQIQSAPIVFRNGGRAGTRQRDRHRGRPRPAAGAGREPAGHGQDRATGADPLVRAVGSRAPHLGAGRLRRARADDDSAAPTASARRPTNLQPAPTTARPTPPPPGPHPRAQAAQSPGAPFKPAAPPANAQLNQRFAQERADIQSRHAQERSALQARHQQERQQLRDPHKRAELQQRQQQETKALNEKQRQEREAMVTRQQEERRSKGKGGA